MNKSILFGVFFFTLICLNCNSQVSSVGTEHLHKVLDACLNKQLEILSCKGYDKDTMLYFPNFVGKIQYSKSRKQELVFSLVNVINPDDIPVDQLTCFYQYKSMNIFLIFSDNIVLDLPSYLSKDILQVQNFLQQFEKIEILEREGVYEVPTISLFTFKMKILKTGKGSILYELIQPITKVQKDLRPVQRFSSSHYNLEIDTTGLNPYGPWDSCARYHLSENELNELKSGVIKL